MVISAFLSTELVDFDKSDVNSGFSHLVLC
jgi:hypothetical protein